MRGKVLHVLSRRILGKKKVGEKFDKKLAVLLLIFFPACATLRHIRRAQVVGICQRAPLLRLRYNRGLTIPFFLCLVPLYQ